MIRSLIAGFAVLASVATTQAAPDPDPNTTTFGYCYTCHGTEGRGNQPVSAPRIGGMEGWYIERQLNAFRAGWRGTHPGDYQGGEMRVMAVALPGPDAVARAAELFAAHPMTETPDTVVGDTERGRVLYGACATCHGDAGEGLVTLEAPALAHQSDWYLVTQLNHYREGVRGSHPDDRLGQQMRAMAATLPDEQAVRDVVAYINALD